MWKQDNNGPQILFCEFGRCQCNTRGDRLYDCCQDGEMIVTNKCFKLPERIQNTCVPPHNVQDNTNPNPVY